ncbi:MAG: MFS transporter [Rhabdaerophilum sp.]
MNTAALPKPDSTYAWWRLALALLVSTIAGVGMWAVVVVLPSVQADFGVARGSAALPYTIAMIGFAFATIVLGKLSDRVGIVLPILIAGISLGLGFALSSYATNLVLFSALHFLVGMGSGAGFAPMMADISHWFVKRRGLAVVIVASGNYLAGALWPLLMNQLMPIYGWRGTYMIIAIVCAITVIPLAFVLRRKPEKSTLDAATTAAAAARADLGLSPRVLQMLLIFAGFSCCVAMSMPQVHIVAYCGDLGYGVARGAEMLSLMLGLGIVSRIASGFVADKIGGAATLLIGSIMQGVALMLYLFFNGLASLYIISAIFGLFQGGIVPMYAVICREFLPPREAGARIGMVMASTIIGMAFGGYVSGLIYDATNSYRLAFLNGVAWNGLNLLVVAWLFMKRQKAVVQPA